MQYTKLQVITLFLGASNAQVNQADLFNQCTKANAAFNEGGAECTASTLTACTTDANCTGTEKCGAMVYLTPKPTYQDLKCIAATNCDMVGILNDQDFKVLCSNSATLAEASRPDVRTEWTDIKGVNGWASKLTRISNVKVLAANNYQGGYWMRMANDTDGTTNGKAIWKFTAKAKRDMCPASGCLAVGGTPTCCMNWPDANNLLCKTKSLSGVTQSDSAYKPMKSFIPKCKGEAAAPPANVVPKNAGSDIAGQSGSKAAESLVTYSGTLETAAKTEAKYSTMTAEAKTAWEKTYKTGADAKAKLDVADLTAAGIKDDAAAKLIYDTELLKWKKATFEICKTTPLDFKCTNARAIRDKTEANRKTTKFYTGTVEARAKLVEAEKATTKKSEDDVKALWVKDVKEGALGFDCTGTASTKCVAEKQCCGPATPKANKAGDVAGQRQVCNTPTLTTFKDKALAEFTFKCGAKQLVASAGAILAAAYYM